MFYYFRKYRILISKDAGTEVAESESYLNSESCQLKQQFEYQIATSLKKPCYITAEVPGSSVGSGGLPIVIGEDNIIGTYYNVPLEANSAYAVAVVVVVRLEVCQSV